MMINIMRISISIIVLMLITFGNSGMNNRHNVSSINKPQAKPTPTSSSLTNSTNSTFASSASTSL